MPNKEEDKIIVRSEEVNEVLTSSPRWILRWGISVVFILIIIGVGLCYFIRYPDILSSNITLTTLNPPAILVAKTNGKITSLLVHNNENVKQYQPIAVIENTADYKDVLTVYEQCIAINNQLKQSDSIPFIDKKEGLKLGELTPSYLLLLKSINDINLYKEVNSYNEQLKLLKKDLVNYNDLLVKYKKQQDINQEQLTLSETDYNRDKALYEQKVIAAREFEIKKKEYLAAQSSYEAIKITVSNAAIQINAIEKNKLQLQLDNYQHQTKLKEDLQQNLKSFISETDKWKQQYLIESPMEGKISFFEIWSINQNVKMGDALFSIVSLQEQQFLGKCLLPTENAGKLAIGQSVNIKLNDYPYNENGMLQGIVKNISNVPTNNAYIVDVDLKNGLITSYNKVLPYKEEMKGQADVITQNLTVMDRIFFNLRKLVQRK
jgi:multidrug resistance efflux pump